MLQPSRPLRIRGLLIDPPLLLAPMAGLTHSALRRVLSGFGGVGLLSTEMLSAKRLPTENPRVSPYLIRTPFEKPVSYQLLTSLPDEIAPAVEALHGMQADAIDLNMGCPAPQAGRLGAGIRLMQQPDHARRLVAEVRKRTALPLTAKIRIGIEDHGRLRDFCVMLQDEGIDLLSVHARRMHESFARTPSWETIAMIKGWLTVPVVANGGVFSVRDAERCMAVSGADGLMLGRGAVIRPWLFAEIAREVFGRSLAAPVVSLPAIYGAFLDNLELFRPCYRLGRLKEFTHYFARNYRFGHHLASRVQSSDTVAEARDRAGMFFERGS
jgi:tRNA-dihydrouridine synthase B